MELWLRSCRNELFLILDYSHTHHRTTVCPNHGLYKYLQKKTFFNMILTVINRIILKGIYWTQYQVLQPWTKCLSSHNWSCESLLQSLQWTNCLSIHNWSCESLLQSLQWTNCLSSHNWNCESLPQSLQSCDVLHHCKRHRVITDGFIFKFNFLISCRCHAGDSGLFTYFLLCDFYSTIDNVLWHAHEMLFSCHISNVT